MSQTKVSPETRTLASAVETYKERIRQNEAAAALRLHEKVEEMLEVVSGFFEEAGIKPTVKWTNDEGTLGYAEVTDDQGSPVFFMIQKSGHSVGFSFSNSSCDKCHARVWGSTHWKNGWGDNFLSQIGEAIAEHTPRHNCPVEEEEREAADSIAWADKAAKIADAEDLRTPSEKLGMAISKALEEYVGQQLANYHAMYGSE